MHLLAAAVIVSAARMGEGGMMRPLCCMELHLLMARGGGEQPKRRSVPLPPACHGLNTNAVVTAPQPCLLHLQV